jgi:TP901-1 family phage major tail protein
MAGEQNGTDILVQVETTPGGGTYETIGGQTSHTATLNNSPIDITNKASQSWREILEGEGLQSFDLSLELIISSDTYYATVKTAARNKSILSYRITMGGETATFSAYIATHATSAPDNDKYTASLSFQSSGAVVWA